MSLLHQTKFFVSAAKLQQLPPASVPEVCFVGRSNVGKSSAINVLTNQKRLAFSSKTPGRTRLINMFGIPDPTAPEQVMGFLVDLPGYGYASVAQDTQEAWADTLGNYLRQRSCLRGIVLLIDIRRGLTTLDKRLADWIAPTGIPVLVLLTKADKLPYGQRIKAIASIKQTLATLGKLSVIPFSSTQRIGIEETGTHLLQWLQGNAEDLSTL